MLETTNELPQFPRKRKKKEASKTPKIIKELEKHYGNFIAEIKVDNRDFKQHQINWLKKASTMRHTVKIPDSAIGKVSVDVHSFKKVDALAVILGTDKKELEVYNYKDDTTVFYPL